MVNKYHWFGYLLILLASAAYGQSNERIIQWTDLSKSTNSGRTYYVVVKTTTDNEFLTDDYDTISKIVAAKKRDKSVLKVELVWPGQTKEIRFKAPSAQTIGVYLLITNPKGDWKALISAPLYHYYALSLTTLPDTSGGANDEGVARPVILAVRKMFYPRRMVDRPLTLYSKMFEVEADFRVRPTPTLLQGHLQARYGLFNNLELGLGYAAGKLGFSGFELGKTFTPRMRTQLSKKMALDLALPIALQPFGMGATLGLPYRVRLGNASVLQLFDRFFSFRFHSRVADERWANEVETSTGVFRLGLRYEQQISDGIALIFRTGPGAPVYRFSSMNLPVDFQAVYTLSSGVDLGLGAGVIDAFVSRAVYVFGLRIAGRIGGT